MEALKTRTDPLMNFADRWGGFFGPLRNLLGVENLCIAFYDNPALVERMMDQRVEAMIAITDRVLDEVEIDTFAFWEDMGFKTASLLGPKHFRKFMVPRYREVTEWVRSRGVKHVGVDSDGDVSELIPLWLEAGLDIVWPHEVAASATIWVLLPTALVDSVVAVVAVEAIRDPLMSRRRGGDGAHGIDVPISILVAVDVGPIVRASPSLTGALAASMLLGTIVFGPVAPRAVAVHKALSISGAANLIGSAIANRARRKRLEILTDEAEGVARGSGGLLELIEVAGDERVFDAKRATGRTSLG